MLFRQLHLAFIFSSDIIRVWSSARSARPRRSCQKYTRTNGLRPVKTYRMPYGHYRLLGFNKKIFPTIKRYVEQKKVSSGGYIMLSVFFFFFWTDRLHHACTHLDAWKTNKRYLIVWLGLLHTRLFLYVSNISRIIS